MYKTQTVKFETCMRTHFIEEGVTIVSLPVDHEVPFLLESLVFPLISIKIINQCSLIALND